jgi:hypothetical protein
VSSSWFKMFFLVLFKYFFKFPNGFNTQQDWISSKRFSA